MILTEDTILHNLQLWNIILILSILTLRQHAAGNIGSLIINRPITAKTTFTDHRNSRIGSEKEERSRKGSNLVSSPIVAHHYPQQVKLVCGTCRRMKHEDISNDANNPSATERTMHDRKPRSLYGSCLHERCACCY